MKTSSASWWCLGLLMAVGCTRSVAPDPTAGSASNEAMNTSAASPLPDSASDAPAGATTADSTAAGTARVVIKPGPQAQREAQEALILAQPGEIIAFAEGKFDFDGTLSLDGIKDITIRGQGMEKTILSFAKVQAGKGGEGLKIKADNFTIEDLTIEDTPGDAIKLQECHGLTMRRVRTWWTKGPDANNGAYGLYPVMSTNVLIEHCVAECASDAGIYVGQSKHVVVRRCRVERNVAGIEIENCLGADVYENIATNNSGGILVFSLPGLTLKNGADCRVFRNEMAANNHANFAKAGAMVATVPPGSGVMIMANDRVEVFDNKFQGNNSAQCLIVSFLVTQRKYDDPGYDPYSEAIAIHDNQFSSGGTDPQGTYFTMYTTVAGKPLPDIVFDGLMDQAKFVAGQPAPDHRLSIVGNGQATFVNLDLGKLLAGAKPEFSTDLAPHASTLPPVKPVAIPGVDKP